MCVVREVDEEGERSRGQTKIMKERTGEGRSNSTPARVSEVNYYALSECVEGALASKFWLRRMAMG